MALIALYVRQRAERERIAELLEQRHTVAGSPSWSGFERLVKERPVTVGVVDLHGLGPRGRAVSRLLRLRTRFPGLGTVVLVRHTRDPVSLFRLGAAKVRNVVLLESRGRSPTLLRGVERALRRGAASRVIRAVSPHLPRTELEAVGLALDGIHHRWSAEDFAEQVGLSRPFLSERFKECGLPSVGHFLIWTRLFHAGHWLTDPGRTAESVSRQLEYSSGAAFRRALRGRTGATPTELIEAGGVRVVLRHFLARCRFREWSDDEVALVAGEEGGGVRDLGGA